MKAARGGGSGTRIGYDVATALWQGKRPYQEDTLLADFHGGMDRGFAVLADGMGGHAAGDLASRLVVIDAVSHLKFLIHDGEALEANLQAELKSAIDTANDVLRDRAAEDSRLAGMGATFLATVMFEDRLYWASVGDSPLYLWRDGSLRQLNEDHSMAPVIDQMVASGEITREEAAKHPDRNALTSVLMGRRIKAMDVPEKATVIGPGDVLIQASDGLQYLDEAAMRAVLEALPHGADSRMIADRLMGALHALDDPSQDNTAILVLQAVDRTDEGGGAARATDAAVTAGERAMAAGAAGAAATSADAGASEAASQASTSASATTSAHAASAGTARAPSPEAAARRAGGRKWIATAALLGGAALVTGLYFALPGNDDRLEAEISATGASEEAGGGGATGALAGADGNGAIGEGPGDIAGDPAAEADPAPGAPAGQAQETGPTVAGGESTEVQGPATPGAREAEAGAGQVDSGQADAGATAAAGAGPVAEAVQGSANPESPVPDGGAPDRATVDAGAPENTAPDAAAVEDATPFRDMQAPATETASTPGTGALPDKMAVPLWVDLEAAPQDVSGDAPDPAPGPALESSPDSGSAPLPDNMPSPGPAPVPAPENGSDSEAAATPALRVPVPGGAAGPTGPVIGASLPSHGAEQAGSAPAPDGSFVAVEAASGQIPAATSTQGIAAATAPALAPGVGLLREGLTAPLAQGRAQPAPVPEQPRIFRPAGHPPVLALTGWPGRASSGASQGRPNGNAAAPGSVLQDSVAPPFASAFGPASGPTPGAASLRAPVALALRWTCDRSG